MPAESPQHLTLGAGTVATVTFAYAYETIEVMNVDGTGTVYFTLDGTDPTIAGIGCEVLPPAISSLAAYRTSFTAPGGGRVVKLISATTPKVSVAGRTRKSRSS